MLHILHQKQGITQISYEFCLKSWRWSKCRKLEWIMFICKTLVFLCKPNDVWIWYQLCKIPLFCWTYKHKWIWQNACCLWNCASFPFFILFHVFWMNMLLTKSQVGVRHQPHLLMLSPYNLLFSQLSPSYPGGQRQVYWLTPSMHVPPFRHGELAHSSISGKEFAEKMIQATWNIIDKNLTDKSFQWKSQRFLQDFYQYSITEVYIFHEIIFKYYIFSFFLLHNSCDSYFSIN